MNPQPEPSAIPISLLSRAPSPPGLTDTSWTPGTHDPEDKALALIPIPPLNRDLSNYQQWEHALWFHIVYHRLVGFLLPTRYPHRECPEAEDKDNWTRKVLHTYAIVFASVGREVLEDMAMDGDLRFEVFGDRDYWAPELMEGVQRYKELVEGRMARDSNEVDEMDEADDEDNENDEDELLVQLRMWMLVDGVFD
ncbi:uncharacterized protein B0T23DRAFT_331352 [Neurospora hispaniola]|uniref:Uncharacterized protein n=1 Tax=Neurospora hispaniola TaxID=588809 RepID=A0AAJ0IHK7_9PEZI|nr:hypothetical protein B0T23DRAFT_331352 [Neurospora hispaniola]